MLQQWQIEILRCPFDRSRLSLQGEAISCSHCGRAFPIVDGIPSLISPDLATSHAREEWLSKQSEMQARDAQARQYDRLLGLMLMSPVERRMTLRALRVKAVGFHVVAEIGCGTGRMLQHLATVADTVIGVDFSLESLKLCRKRMKHLGKWDATLLVHADACFLPLPDTTLDAVASCQLLEHLPSDRLRQQVLAEIARVLKPEGRYAVSGYHWSWLTRWNGTKQGVHDGGIYYYRFTYQEFHAMISAHLSVESLRSVLGYVWLASGKKEG
ncbi:MAG: methyltransferase domain-containing protein [Armatimonadota bacterium]